MSNRTSDQTFDDEKPDTKSNYYHRNAAELRAKRNAKYAADPTKDKGYAAAYYAANREKVLAKRRAKRAEEKE